MLHYDPQAFSKTESMFPIRFVVRSSYGDLTDVLARVSQWFAEGPEPARYGFIPGFEASLLYFLHPEDAARFLGEFPHLILDSGVADTAGDAFHRDQTGNGRAGSIGTNFHDMTQAELVSMRAQLDKAIKTVGERDRQRALKAAKDLVRQHGFSLAELVPKESKGRGAGGRQGTRSTVNRGDT